MSGQGPVHYAESRSELSTGLRESIPLLAVSLLLFLAGAVFRVLGPKVGPPFFPLWALLILLGFVAGIGAVISWFGAGNAPLEPKPRTDSGAIDGRGFGAERTGGRPPPMTRRPSHSESRRLAEPAEPWDEGPAPLAARVSAAPAESADGLPSRPPRPSDPAKASDTDAVLTELDGIQHAVGPRRKPTNEQRT